VATAGRLANEDPAGAPGGASSTAARPATRGQPGFRRGPGAAGAGSAAQLPVHHTAVCWPAGRRYAAGPERLAGRHRAATGATIGSGGARVPCLTAEGRRLTRAPHAEARAAVGARRARVAQGEALGVQRGARTGGARLAATIPVAATGQAVAGARRVAALAVGAIGAATVRARGARAAQTEARAGRTGGAPDPTRTGVGGRCAAARRAAREQRVQSTLGRQSRRARSRSAN